MQRLLRVLSFLGWLLSGKPHDVPANARPCGWIDMFQMTHSGLRSGIERRAAPVGGRFTSKGRTGIPPVGRRSIVVEARCFLLQFVGRLAIRETREQCK